MTHFHSRVPFLILTKEACKPVLTTGTPPGLFPGVHENQVDGRNSGDAFPSPALFLIKRG